jgi:hypothetical protein
MTIVKKASAPKRKAPQPTPQSAAPKKSRKSYSLVFKAEVVAFVKAQHDAKVKAPLVAALEKYKNTPEGTDLNKSCVSDWWKDQEKILKAATSVIKNSAQLNRARTRKVQNETVEAAVVEWCSEKTKQGMLLSGLVIREKARAFQEKMGGPPVKFSEGWLYSFCNQYVRLMKITMED